MSELRLATLAPLLTADAPAKAAATLALPTTLPVDTAAVLAEPAGIPGRPACPRLVEHITLKPPSMRTPAGIAALVHAIAHIELNAIDLALDICWRFPDMPEAFYRDWLRIAQEEARHFTLLREHLLTLGFDYGDFDAHNALWDMAQRTRHDLLARIALVPRTLEARGLDASPAVRRKLVGAGDHRAGDILDIILRDEIGHVAAGNRWYRFLCEQRGLDAVATYAELAARHQAPKLRAPFNLEARRAAGFDEAELAALAQP
ncbi:ferritin-like domain-containing protein [Roseateles sp.]|uniref:ferritin-like domain-containing protein n=1 Tax=Roseateles sp. TaxID=1971397 RepID=UPI0025E40B7A|nr:ferritin-like domain-containing protein [Roseateles sp.]MBV8033752.1 ferritin-like domain-containing protein [Roseateles sp.]